MHNKLYTVNKQSMTSWIFFLFFFSICLHEFFVLFLKLNLQNDFRNMKALFKPGMLNVNYGTMAQKHKINQVKWFAL